eukprot:1733468-Alexandrium_andersonii.AAC.1
MALFVSGVMDELRNDVPQYDDAMLEQLLHGPGPRVLAAPPPPPSSADIAKHNTTHLPYAAWCPACVSLAADAAVRTAAE